MERAENTTTVTEDDVRKLAHVARLPLQPGRAAALAGALEADLRAIRRLRAVDAGEAYPAGVAPLAEVRRDG
jgi:Asp-tRNA(Asn)/Glu-tRNA(Gln) amidotransferase C subunit